MIFVTINFNLMVTNITANSAHEFTYNNVQLFYYSCYNNYYSIHALIHVCTLSTYHPYFIILGVFNNAGPHINEVL